MLISTKFALLYGTCLYTMPYTTLLTTCLVMSRLPIYSYHGIMGGVRLLKIK